MGCFKFFEGRLRSVVACGAAVGKVSELIAAWLPDGLDPARKTQFITPATSGPGGLQAGMFPCQAADLRLYLLVPCTSDHLANLEGDASVVVTTEAWQLRGLAHVVPPGEYPAGLALLNAPDARWSEVVEICPTRFDVRQRRGWGYSETIDLE
jgi:hypothetical protein